MARIPYVPANIAEPKDIVDAVRARRGGDLLELDRLLLHSPPLTQGWNVYLKAIRTQLAIDARLRELAICTVAVLNAAEYEYENHLPFFLAAGGTPEQGRAIRNINMGLKDDGLFDAAERAILRLTHEMTRNVQVSDVTFDAASKALGSTQAVVEMVAVIATYNMVSRFLVALNLHPN